MLVHFLGWMAMKHVQSMKDDNFILKKNRVFNSSTLDVQEDQTRSGHKRSEVNVPGFKDTKKRTNRAII